MLYAITATGITANTLLTASIKEILDGLQAPTSLAGVVIGAATLPGIALAPVIGLLADRYGRREVLVPCLVLFAVAGGLGSVAPSLTVLAILRFLQGVGSAGLINLVVVLIGDHWEGTERATIIGRNAAVLTTCLAILPIIGGLLTDLGGWRAPFLAYPLALITAIGAWRSLPPNTGQHIALHDQLLALLPTLRQRTVVATLILGGVTFALIFGLILTVLPLYAGEAFGISPSLRGVLLGLPAVTNTAAALSLGPLRRRVSRQRLLFVAATCFIASCAMLAVSPVLGVLIAGLLVFGLGEGMMIPNLQDIATGAASTASRGTTVALFVSSARLGQTLGPMGAGAVYGATNAPVVFALGALISVGLLLTMVTALAGDPAGPHQSPPAHRRRRSGP